MKACQIPSRTLEFQSNNHDIIRKHGGRLMEHELSKRRRNLILVNAAFMTFMATLDGSIVNIALPTIAQSFSVGISAVQWVVTSYLIVVSALLLVWGRLSDIYGRKTFFAVGIGVFALGSLLSGLSTSLAALVASRFLQAVGASMALALVQGIVTSIFPANERGKALGFIGAVVSIGSLIGPSLGGFLVNAAGWQSIFFVNVPIGLLGVILTIRLMPDTAPKAAKGSFDTQGALLISTAIIVFFSGMLAFQEGFLSLPLSMVAILVSIVLLIAFVRVEKKPESLVDKHLFGNRTFSIGIVVSSLSYMAMFSYIFFMPFYLQGIRGLSVVQTGILMSLYPIVTAVLAPLAGALSDRITYRPLTLSGLLMSAIGLASLAVLDQNSSIILIGAMIVLLGVGGASFQSPNNSSVMGAAPRDRLGIAGSINAFFRNLGMVSGTAVAVSLFTFSSRLGIDQVAAGVVDVSKFLRGFRVVVLSASAFALLGIVLELSGRPRRPDVIPKENRAM
jgi:EmrB/QacA subfamily drug resistance transporter